MAEGMPGGVHAAVLRLVHAAITQPATLLSATAGVVNHVRGLCQGVPEEEQAPVRKVLADLVAAAKKFSQVNQTHAEDRLHALAALSTAGTTLTEETTAFLAARAPPPGGATDVPGTPTTPAAPVADPPATASAAPSAAATPTQPPSRPNAFSAMADTLDHDIAALINAIDKWELPQIISCTTTAVRQLPQLLKHGDSYPDNQQLQELRKRIVAGCNSLTSLARDAARAQGSNALQGEMLKAAQQVEADVAQFVYTIDDAATDESSPTKRNPSSWDRLAQRLEERHAPNQPAFEDPKQALENSCRDLASILLTFQSNLDGGTPMAAQAVGLTYQTVDAACQVLDAADDTFTTLFDQRETCFKLLQELIAIVRPLAEGKIEANIWDTLSKHVPVLSRAVMTLQTAASKLPKQKAWKPPASQEAVFEEEEEEEVEDQSKITHNITNESDYMEFQRHRPPPEMGDSESESEGELQAATKESGYIEVQFNQANISFMVNTQHSVIDTESSKVVLSSNVFTSQGLGINANVLQLKDYIANRFGIPVSAIDVQLDEAPVHDETLLKALPLGPDEPLEIIDTRPPPNSASSSSPGAFDGFTAKNNPGRPQAAAPQADKSINSGGTTRASMAASHTFRRKKAGKGNIAQVLKEGMLTKEGGSVKTWKTRWFVLTSMELSYFKSPTDQRPLGVLCLDDYQSCEARSELRACCFSIEPKQRDGRTYNICASSDEEMLDWVEAIDGAIPGRRSFADRLCVVQACVEQLMLSGTQKDGIFRNPGNMREVKQLCQAFVSGEPLDLENVLNPLTLASFLKKILKEELLKPLVPKISQDRLQRAILIECLDQAALLDLLQQVIESVPPQHQVVIRSLLRLLDAVCKNVAETNMTTDDIARSFGPAVLTCMEEDCARQTLELMMMYSDQLAGTPGSEA